MSYFSKGAVASALAGLVLSHSCGTAAAAVDPTNMGKGDWIYIMSSCQTALGVTDVQGVIDYEVNKGMKWIVVKAGHGAVWWPQFNADLITRAHAAGLQVFGYGRCFGDDVTGEINIGKQVLALGADGFIINAEIEYENKFTQATAMMNGLRATYPTAFIAHAPFAYIDYHTAFPYVQFGSQCDAVMPQCYWRAAGINKDPYLMVQDLDYQWNKWHNTWTNNGNAAAIKPVVPIGDGYNTHAGSEITSFVTCLKTTPTPATAPGYRGVSFFSCQSHTASHWTAIGTATIGVASDIIVDNSASAFSATSNWSTGTSAGDKYGSNYRFRPTAPASDAAVWNMTVPSAGNWKVYAWWTQGTNRSTTAPYILPNNTSVPVNQRTNGGKWNLLGTQSVAAGARTVKLSCWTTSGSVVLADAVKLSQQ